MIVPDSNSLSDHEIIQLFDEIKNHFREEIMEEDEKAFFIFVSDLCCKDLINKRGNPIKNRKDRDSTEGATQENEIRTTLWPLSLSFTLPT